MTHETDDESIDPGPRTLKALEAFKKAFIRELEGLKDIARDELSEEVSEYFINWVEENIRDQGVEFFET